MHWRDYGLLCGPEFCVFCVGGHIGTRGALGPRWLVLLAVLGRRSWCCSCSLWLFVALWFPRCFPVFSVCCDAGIVVAVYDGCPLCFLFCWCVVALAFWSPSEAARFVICFAGCDWGWHRDPGWGWPALGCLSPSRPPPPPPPPPPPRPPLLAVCSAGRYGAVVSVALFCFVVCSVGRFVLCLALCCFVLVFFGPFGGAVASCGAGLGAFCTFVRFALVWFCLFLFLLVSGKGCGLWLWHSLGFSLTLFLWLLKRPLLSKSNETLIWSCIRIRDEIFR